MAELEPLGSASARLDPQEENGTLILHLSGDLDVTSADYVRSAIDAALSGQANQVIFDLAGLEFMDSSGIALLLSVVRKVSDVRVRNPSPIVARLIELTGLAETFRIRP